MRQGLVEGSLERSDTVDQRLQKFWQQYFALEHRKEGALSVAVLALAKSGMPLWQFFTGTGCFSLVNCAVDTDNVFGHFATARPMLQISHEA